MIEHFDIPLGSPEEKMSAFGASFAQSRLEEGKLGFFETVEGKTYEEIVKAFPDYKENQESYDGFLSMGDYTIGADAKEIKVKRYQNAIDRGVYQLDENNNVVNGPNHNALIDLMFNKNDMRGLLLARKNGFTDDMFQNKYAEIVKSREQELAEAEKDTAMEVLGSISGYLASPETAMDFASPAKIMGKTLTRGAIKAFTVEGAYIASGEIMREQKRKRHALNMNEDRTLWEGTQEILINSGLGGLIRGIGSAVVDAKTMRDIHKRVGEFSDVDDALTDKQIFAQFASRENFKLLKDSNLHFQAMELAEEQLEKGAKVEVPTDIPIEEKFTDMGDTVDFIQELQKTPEVKADLDYEDVLKKELDNYKPKEEDIDFADDNLINDYINDPRLLEDVEAQELIKEIKLPKGSKETVSKQERLRQASQVGLGESEDEAKARVVRIMNEKDPETFFKQLSPDDLDELNRMYNEEEQRIIMEEAQQVFSKFGDNLAAGTVAGLEIDEQGNINFNPEMFVAGLGGYTALKALGKSAIRLAEEGGEELERQAGGKSFKDELDTELNSQYKYRDDGESTTKRTDIGDRFEKRPNDGKDSTYEKPKGLLERKKALTQSKIDKGIIPEAGRRVMHPRATQGYYFLGDSGKVYFEARGQWIEMPNEDIIKEVNEIVDIGYNKFKEKEKLQDEEYAKALAESEAREQAKAESPDFYKDQHTAPTRDQDNATSIDDLLKIYPSDIYSKNSARFYGHGDKKQDETAAYLLRKIKDNPEADVVIYRAVPKDLDVDINVGDWVTITKSYAKEHGENRFDGEYKILEKKVKAKDVITDGNSLHEQGYDPLKETK